MFAKNRCFIIKQEWEREVLSDFAFGGLAPLHNLLNINDLKSFINTIFASFITTCTRHKELFTTTELYKRPAASNCN
jgi:hypothetical protein